MSLLQAARVAVLGIGNAGVTVLENLHADKLDVDRVAVDTDVASLE